MRSCLFAYLLLALFVAISSVAIPSAAETPVGSEAQSATAHFELEHILADDAAVVLRAIAGLKSVDRHGESRIDVTGSAELVATASAVIELIDVPAGHIPTMETLEVESDQTVIARSMLQPAMVREVMTAVRKELHVHHMAIVEDPPLIILRDSAEKIESAKQLIQSMQ